MDSSNGLSSLDSSALGKLRRFVFLILAGTLLSAAAELYLVGHYEDPWQFVPLVLIPAALAALVWLAVAPSKAAAGTWHALMVLLVASGLVGFYLHGVAKIEFKQETDASLTGFRLFWEAMKSVSPPALAPGVMIQAGLLGWVYAYLRLPRKSASAAQKEQGAQQP